MDTSETYIKMRLAAIPDLGMGNPPESFGEEIITGGEDTYNFQTDNVFIDAKGDFYYSDETQACQLERQDQLQEILGYRYPVNYAINLGRWCENLSTSEYNQVNLYSMEQLWLAFVMKEKHNKTWNGEEWITS